MASAAAIHSIDASAGADAGAGAGAGAETKADLTTILQVFIEHNIVPHLPSVSITQLKRFAHMELPSAENALSAVLLSRLIQKFINEINPDLIGQMALAAVLLEHFHQGNCLEQAAFATQRLYSSGQVQQVILMDDEANDHVYLHLIDLSGTRWAYDPWLIPNQVLRPEDHVKRMTDMGLAKYDSKPKEIPLDQKDIEQEYQQQKKNFALQEELRRTFARVGLEDYTVLQTFQGRIVFTDEVKAKTRTKVADTVTAFFRTYARAAASATDSSIPLGRVEYEY